MLIVCRNLIQDILVGVGIWAIVAKNRGSVDVGCLYRPTSWWFNDGWYESCDVVGHAPHVDGHDDGEDQNDEDHAT